jgi:hypothetical protein
VREIGDGRSFRAEEWSAASPLTDLAQPAPTVNHIEPSVSVMGVQPLPPGSHLAHQASDIIDIRQMGPQLERIRRAASLPGMHFAEQEPSRVHVEPRARRGLVSAHRAVLRRDRRKKAGWKRRVRRKLAPPTGRTGRVGSTQIPVVAQDIDGKDWATSG